MADVSPALRASSIAPPLLEAGSLRRIACLDGIRALAAVMILCFHFAVAHQAQLGRVFRVAVIGQTGVDLFFVLSGFLITRILLASKESPHFFRAFYARRTLRIFPLYYAFLVVYYFLMPPVFGTSTPPFGSQWWYWCYLQNIPPTFTRWQGTGPGHFWSLAVEEHFYLVWPLLVYLLSRRHFAIVIGVTLVAPVLIRYWFLREGIEVFYFTLTRADALGYGALLAVLLAGELPAVIRHPSFFRLLLAGMTLLLVPSFVLLSGKGFLWLETLKPTLTAAFYFALLGFCIVDPAARPLAAIFSVGVLRWLGTISYGLYVFHLLCFALVHRFVAAASRVPVDFVLSFGLTILVAYLSFRFFESPILRLKSRFRYEVRPARAV